MGRWISCSQWDSPSMHSSCLVFFPFKFGGRKDFFFIFPWFPLCSQYVPQVPNVFPNMFSTVPHFYPICIGKCFPPFTYISVGQRGETLYFKIEPFIFGSLHRFISFIFLEWWANHFGSLQKKEKNLEGTSLHIVKEGWSPTMVLGTDGGRERESVCVQTNFPSLRTVRTVGDRESVCLFKGPQPVVEDSGRERESVCVLSYTFLLFYSHSN